MLATIGSRSVPAGRLVIVNTRTRDVTAREASDVLRTLVQQLLAEDDEITWTKRVDSLLRGQVRAELDTVLELVQPCGGVFAPAVPEAGRHTRNGRHYHHDRLVVDLRDLIRGLPLVTGVDVGGQLNAAGHGRWWIPEIASPTDADRVAAALGEHPDHLVVETGRLASRLAAETLGRILVVQGSSTALVARQVARLRAKEWRDVDVLYVPIAGPADPRLATLASEAAERIRTANCMGVIVGGGLTAEHLLDHLSEFDIAPRQSFRRLQGLAELVSGDSQRILLATKGGEVGDDNTLVEIVCEVRALGQSRIASVL
jgi:uncharacterized protein YgbK (DUF1537 family)